MTYEGILERALRAVDVCVWQGTQCFFAEQISLLEKGKVLLPAEGEGRNAVYAALKGWEVHAFDFSQTGRDKALQLAKEYEVNIAYQLIDVDGFEPSDSYHAIGLIYGHFAGSERKQLFEKLANALLPGGHIIIEVFSKNQLGRESGGPKSQDLLYSREEIKDLLPNLDFMVLEEMKIDLNEGANHQGEAAVIRALATKRTW